MTKLIKKRKSGGLIPMFKSGNKSSRRKTSAPSTTQSQSNSSHGFIMYLHYPNYWSHSKNVLTGKAGQVWNNTSLSDINVPVGHSAVILVDNTGNAQYYEYGRYNESSGGAKMYGYTERDKGNFRKMNLPKRRAYETNQHYVTRIRGMLPAHHAGTLQVSVANNADTQAAQKYIDSLANNKDRSAYSIANTCATFASDVYEKSRRNTIASRLGLSKVESGVKQLFDRGIYNIMNTEGNIATRIFSTVPGTSHSQYNRVSRVSDDNFVLK